MLKKRGFGATFKKNLHFHFWHLVLCTQHDLTKTFFSFFHLHPHFCTVMLRRFKKKNFYYIRRP